MGRNDVDVTKDWAPTLREIQEKVSRSEKVHTIVMQALTRDMADIPVEDFLPKLYETVEKCLLKSEKVIVSLVVCRNDKKDIETKVDFVNANIKFKYLNNPNILICNHDNLDDSKYRKRDQLHLNEFGTSRYANNIKYKIAEALGITIERRRRYPEIHDRNSFDERREHDRNDRNENRGQHFNGRQRSNDYAYRYDEYRRTNDYNQK